MTPPRPADAGAASSASAAPGPSLPPGSATATATILPWPSDHRGPSDRAASGRRGGAPGGEPGGGPRRRRLADPLRLLLPAAVALPLAVLSADAWLSWRQTWQEAEAEVERAAGAAAEYARRVLDAQRLAVARVNDMLRGLSDEQIRAREAELHAGLRALVAETPQVQTAYVLDRNARFLLSATAFPVWQDADMSDREHHTLLAFPGAPDTALTRIYRGRYEGNLFFAVARRRRDTGNALPPGAFDGQANVSVNPEEVGAGLYRLLREPGDSIALVRTDGEVLARSRGFSDRPPPLRLGPDSPMLAVMRRGEERATVVGRASIDGAWRIAAYRRIEEWPAYVVAARPRSAVVARWREAVAAQLAIGLPAMLALLGLALVVRRGQHALAAANAGLERGVAERTAELAERGAMLAERSAALAESERRNREVLESLGDLLYALDRDARVRFASRRVLETWGLREAEVLGRGLLDLFPQLPGSMLWEAVQRGLRDREEVHVCGVSPVIGGWTEIDVHPAEHGGGVTVAVRDLEGRRAAELERRRAEAALRESEERLRLAQQAGGIGTWEADPATGRLYWSASAYRLWGMEPGEPVTVARAVALVHPEDRDRVGAALRVAARMVGRIPDLEFRILRRSDGAPRRLLARGEAIGDKQGRPLRHVGIMRDITEQKAAEERLRLLAGELDHRAKNALAVVQAALRLTPKDDAATYARAVEGRIAALARAHTLLAQGSWEGAALRALVEAELAVFLPAGGECGGGGGAGRSAAVLPPPYADAEGPPVMLSPRAAQGFSMALHELATNAVKYGALGIPGGRVAVSWRVERAGGPAAAAAGAAAGGPALRLRWVETGGPPVSGAPPRRGFGSRVIEATMRDQLGGLVDRRWETTGLCCVITVPLARVEAGSGGGGAAEGGGGAIAVAQDRRWGG